MQPSARANVTRPSSYAEHIEDNIVRLFGSIVVLLLILGGLVWGTVATVQKAPQPVSDLLFVFLALGGMALAGAVLVLLAQLARWVRRRVDW
jgi:uncharacterized membrane protein